MNTSVLFVARFCCQFGAIRHASGEEYSVGCSTQSIPPQQLHSKPERSWKREMPNKTTIDRRKRLSAGVLWKMVAASILAAMAVTRTKAVAAFGPALAQTPRSVNLASSARLFASVTGSVYESESSDVVVTLYTKEGCTLCDKVKDVLREVQQGNDDGFQHSLRQIDITDSDQQDSFDRYKYDIPVLHISSKSDVDQSVYWTKHRLTEDEAKEGIAEAMAGPFEPRKGRPNAAAMER